VGSELGKKVIRQVQIPYARFWDQHNISGIGMFQGDDSY